METSIPINYWIAAAKDADLKLLLRQKATAERRVQRAVEALAETEQQIASYVSLNYPTSVQADAAPVPA